MCVFEKIKQNKNENKTKKKRKSNTPGYVGWCRNLWEIQNCMVFFKRGLFLFCESWAISQLCHGENKLHFDGMRMKSFFN
jgi:hypothetical protein